MAVFLVLAVLCIVSRELASSSSVAIAPYSISPSKAKACADEKEYDTLSGIERNLLQKKAGEKNYNLWMEQHLDGGLSPKPDTSGPDSPTWRNSMAICSMIKDENSTDVREWVLYYRYAFLRVRTPSCEVRVTSACDAIARQASNIARHHTVLEAYTCVVGDNTMVQRAQVSPCTCA